jgi:hypothetical protein
MKHVTRFDLSVTGCSGKGDLNFAAFTVPNERVVDLSIMLMTRQMVNPTWERVSLELKRGSIQSSFVIESKVQKKTST